MRTDEKVSCHELAAYVEFVLQTAVHRTAGRREFCKADFSPLQLTQELFACMKRKDRKLHFRGVHMKVIPDIMFERCECCCFSSCSLILVLFLPLYYLRSALPFLYDMVT